MAEKPRIYSIHPDSFQRIARATKIVEGSDLTPDKSKIRPRSRDYIWVEITGIDSVISDNKWLYTFSQKRRTATGWEAALNPITGVCINSVEANNTTTGSAGNSINLDSLPAGFSLQPISGFPVLKAYIDYLENGTAVWTVEYVNAVDGDCESGSSSSSSGG